MKGRWHQPIRFLFIHFRHIPGRNPLAALRTKYGAVICGKIHGTLDDSVVIHLHKITLPDFLIVGDVAFAMGAAYLQDMAAPDFFAIWVFIDFHLLHPYSDKN